MPRKNPRHNHVRVRSYVRRSGVRVKGHRRMRPAATQFEHRHFRTSDDEQKAISLLRHNKPLVMQSGAINVLESTGVPGMYASDSVLQKAGFSSTEIQHIRSIEQ